MRNLKRMLSMLLALAMLLGMVTTGVSAAETTPAAEAPAAVTVGTFKDADLITYTDEVSIMAGMGLFAGTTDGKFDPLGTVTRAQMVTVLVKALRGNDFNANAFKGTGVNPFPDTASFEGGWAEGYITAGHQMGIVGGYGDGTFKPGKAVTTAEALTMIINALKVDAGVGEWPSTIMAKAEEMKLYGELKTKPATNDPMNREQLAVVTYEGMCYSPKGVSGYKIPGADIVFTDIADAMKANGGVSGITEVVGEDALANQIYTLKIAKGFVTANQSTGHDQTTIASVKGDGTLDVGVDYFVKTDLSMVGHYVTVYYKEAYKNDNEPGKVYTIVDETEVVEVKEDITASKDYKAAFGKTYQLKDTNKVILLDGEYNYTGVGTVPASANATAYVAGNTAPKGTYFIADNAVVGYMNPVTKYASYIVDLNKYEGSESVLISGANNDDYIPNTEGNDLVVEYRGMLNGDFIVYHKVQNVYVLELVNPIQGTVTKTSQKDVNGVPLDVVTMDGTEYVEFSGINNNGNKFTYDVSTIDYARTYELYVTDNDEFVGFKAVGDIAVDDIVYVLGVMTVTQKNAYGDSVTEYKARGIDMDAKERIIVVGKELPADGLIGSTGAGVKQGFYSVADHTGRDEKKENLQTLTPVSTRYDGKGGVFATKSTIANDTFFSNGWRFFVTTDGLDTYGKTGSKYIFVDGSLTAPNLDIQTVSSLSSFPMDRNFDMLVTRNANNITNDIEVMVVVGQSGTDVSNSDGIYLSAQQIADGHQTSDGFIYEGYLPSDGTLTQIIVGRNNAQPVTPGFYGVKTETDGVSAVTLLPHNDKTSMASAYIRQNQAILGIVQERTLESFNLSDGVHSGHDLEWNSSASGMRVIDVRTDEQIEKAQSVRITSRSQMTDLIENDPTRVVIADVYVKDASSDSVETIFIKDVLRKTPGLKSVVYSSGVPAASGQDVSMTVVKSVAGADVGSAIKVAYDSITDTTVDGFFYYGINASGKPALERVTVASDAQGYPGTIGQHNTVTAVDVANGTITTENLHAACGVVCSHANEAVVGLLDVTDSLILDKDGKPITLAKLAELVNAGQVVVNYYCADAVVAGEAATDNTPELILVCDSSTTNYKHHSEHSCGHTHDSIDDWQPLSTQMSRFANGSLELPAGNYYLDQDITLPTATGTTGKKSNHIRIAGDSTICLNGYSLMSGDGQQYILYMNGAHTLDICDCSAEQSGKITGFNGGISTTYSAIIVRAGSTVNLYGGEISGNNAPSTVYVAANSTFNMKGGKITGNTTTTNGAVHVAASGTFNMSGGEISGNTVPGTQVTGTVNQTGGTITENSGGGGGGTTPPAPTGSHEHSCSHGHLASGVAATDWKPLSGELSKFAMGGLPLTAGHYYLDEDITLPAASGTDGKKSNHIQINGNATLCLNGHSLNSGDGQQFIIYLNGAYTLDICDCSTAQSGKITGFNGGNNSSTYSVMIVRGGSTVNLYAGEISGNTAYSIVYVANSTFNMKGGKITGNTATTNGAVHVASGTFNMSGGEISGNVVPSTQVTGTVNQTGGTITENGAHTVTVNNTDPNGTVSATPTSGLPGVTVTVTATPNAGYVLDQILVDGNPISGNTFAITGDHTVTATFDVAPFHQHSCSNGHPTAAEADWVKLNQSMLASATGAYTLSAGHYYLEENINLPAGAYLSVAGNTEVTICLNGKTLTGSSVGYTIKIAGSNGVLNICDCVGGGEVVQSRTGALTTASGTVIVTGSNSEFNLYAGTVEGGVVLDCNALNEGKFNMHGGKLKATGANDVIFLNKNKAATVTISNGTFEGIDSAPAEIVVGTATTNRTVRIVNMYGTPTQVADKAAATYQLVENGGQYTLTEKN